MPTNNAEVLRIRALPDPHKYCYRLNWPKRADGSVISPKRLHTKASWFAAQRQARKERWRALMQSKPNPQL